MNRKQLTLLKLSTAQNLAISDLELTLNYAKTPKI